jgi:hypothetical protein
MASVIANGTTRAVKAQGQRLLIDTGRMSVRRISKNEGTLLSALKTLGAAERSTLVSFVSVLEVKKRNRKAIAADAPVSAEPPRGNDHG